MRRSTQKLLGIELGVAPRVQILRIFVVDPFGYQDILFHTNNLAKNCFTINAYWDSDPITLQDHGDDQRLTEAPVLHG